MNAYEEIKNIKNVFSERLNLIRETQSSVTYTEEQYLSQVLKLTNVFLALIRESEYEISCTTSYDDTEIKIDNKVYSINEIDSSIIVKSKNSADMQEIAFAFEEAINAGSFDKSVIIIPAETEVLKAKIILQEEGE